MILNIKQYSRDRKGGARQRGYTLIELVVTVAVAIILVAVAMPTFWTLIEDNRLTAQANDFVTDAYVARGEAVSRGRRVTMCRCVSDSTGKCVDASGDFTCNTSAGTNWDQGWIVFVDADEDAEHDGTTEQVIRLHNRLPAELDLIGGNTVADYISFNGRGLTATTTGGLQAGTITLENADQPTADGKIFERTITIGFSGSVESCNPNYATCP